MQINPYAWLVTVPLTIAMVQVALAPADNFIRRMWLMVKEMEAEAWFRLGRGYCAPLPPEKSRRFRLLYVTAIVAFGVMSAVSFCAFVGLIPGTV